VLDELFAALVPGEVAELLLRFDELDELLFGAADELDEFGELLDLDELELLLGELLDELLLLRAFGDFMLRSQSARDCPVNPEH